MHREFVHQTARLMITVMLTNIVTTMRVVQGHAIPAVAMVLTVASVETVYLMCVKSQSAALMMIVR
jgi:hypothetical protein